MYLEKLHLKDRFSFLGENGADPVLDIALRENLSEMHRENDRRPCMIVLPGGGYHFCSQREAEPVAARFFADGYNTFTLWYSVKPHAFPRQLREVAAVLEVIYENAEKWHCDTDRIAIIGFSAGGHLACHYSNAYDWPEVRSVFPDSKPVRACVLSYPVISFDPAIRHERSYLYLAGDQASAENEKRLSCENMVSEKTPPTYLWHTAADTNVPVQNSLVYAAALAQQKIPFSLRIFPYGKHGLSTADKETNDTLAPEIARVADWLPDVKNWLETVMR